MLLNTRKAECVCKWLYYNQVRGCEKPKKKILMKLYYLQVTSAQFLILVDGQMVTI